MLVACGGGGGEDPLSGGDTVVPTLQFSASAEQVVAGEQVTLSWSSTNATTCTATGDWSGSRPTAGTATMGPMSTGATYRLECSGSGGEVERQVTIAVSSGGGGQILGQVDSSLIDPQTVNRIYVYQGNVSPDDRDGDGGDPIRVVDVVTEPGLCTWSYSVGGLDEGDYTLAFTSEAAQDDPVQDDVIAFQGTRQVKLQGSPLVSNFDPARVLRVGPGRSYATPSAAEADAQDGDVIEIDAGEYLDDVAVWRQNGLTLRGVGGRAHMRATQIIPYQPGNDQANGKGIWVTRGANLRVENIEFSGARVPDQNGAGIRAEGNGLWICNSYFHDNENGILGGGGEVRIEYSEFDHNGLGEYGKTHNIYIVGTSRFILAHSYSHHAYIGHNVKTRARENHILYNRIMDEADGQSSYAVDVPNGGLTLLLGNLVQQGVNTDNSTAISYGAEGLSGDGREHRVYLVNNTIVNDLGSGNFVYLRSGTSDARLINNLFVGSGTPLSGSATQVSNLSTTAPMLVDIDNYDYRLLSGSPAIDAGSDPGSAGDDNFAPVYQYVHPTNRNDRPADALMDIGAYEYSP
jgi:hypothetical protein